MKINELYDLVINELSKINELDYIIENKKFQNFKNVIYNKVGVKNEVEFEKYIIENTPKLSRNYYGKILSPFKDEIWKLEKENLSSYNKEILEEFKLTNNEYRKLNSKIENIEAEEKKEKSKIYIETYKKIDFILHLIERKELVVNCDKKYPSNKEKMGCFSFTKKEYNDNLIPKLNVLKYLNNKIDIPVNWKSEFSEIFNSKIQNKFDGNLSFSTFELNISNYKNNIDFSILLALKKSLKINENIISENGTIFHNMSNGIVAKIRFFKHTEKDKLKFYKRSINDRDYSRISIFYPEYNSSLYKTDRYSTNISFDDFYIIKNKNYYIDVSFSASPFLLNTNNALIASTSIIPIKEDEKRLEELYD